MNNAEINYSFIISQIRHWLATPSNSYLGSNYGIDLKQYLHKPMTQFDADGIIRKMRNDIPILSFVSQDDLNVYAEDDGIDGKIIWIQLSDKLIRAL